MLKVLIETQRLKIRNMNPVDLQDFYIYRSNPEVTKFQGFDVMTLQEAENFINRQKDKVFGKPGEWVQYAIENSEISKIVGDCAIKLDGDDKRIAEIGITISHLHQRNGYAKEVMIAIINFLFAIPDFHRIVEIVDAENIASITLLESVGFKKEGHFVENIFFKGKLGSEYQYAILKKDWKNF